MGEYLSYSFRHFAISPDSRGVWAAQVRLELIWLGRAMSHVYCAMCQMRTWAKNKDKRTKDMSVDWGGMGGSGSRRRVETVDGAGFATNFDMSFGLLLAIGVGRLTIVGLRLSIQRDTETMINTQARERSLSVCVCVCADKNCGSTY